MRQAYKLLLILLIVLPTIFRAQIRINEYSVSNMNGFVDNFGNYEDWIELYNAGTTPVNLTGYHLADKLSAITKWSFGTVIINPGGFVRVWASNKNIPTGTNIHTTFSLKQCQGEKIILTNAANVILDSLTLKKTQNGHSRGRSTDGATTWSVFTTPTPGASNNSSTPYLGYSSTPVMSLAQGFYTGPQVLSITCPDPATTIKYTTNGFSPNSSGITYFTPLSINTTSVIRAQATSTNTSILPSFVESNTYFINVTHSVNVASVYGDDIGILLNGSSINTQTGLEYFDHNKILRAEAFGEANEHGNDSWFYPQRGFDYICRDQFGYSDAIKYQVFNSSPRNEFQRLIFKAGANDNYPFEGTPNSNFAGELGGAHIRDPYVHVVAQKAGMHCDGRSWAPVIVYVNGDYRGVYDVREKVDDKDYTEYYYDTKDDSLQFLQTWGSTWSAYGGAQAQTDWNNFKNTVTAGSFNINTPANYAYVDSLYNLKSLADYVILNSYVVCLDWLNWNTSWWRGLNYKADKKKWRYALWDEDATFKHYINYTNVPDPGAAADPCDPSTLSNPGGQGHIPILNKLITNPTFKQYYVMRYFDLINTGLSCNRMTTILDSMVNVIKPEMPAQIARWGGSYTQWLQNVADLRLFIQQRCDTITKLFNSCYNTTGPYKIKINVDPPNSGTVDFNSIKIASFLWQGTYPGNLPNIIKAHPKTNYCFSHWTTKTHTLSPNMNDSVVNLLLNGNDSIVAHFIYNPKPSVTPSSTTICYGNSIQLNASNGLNYSWLPSASLSCNTCPNPIATPAANVVYTVTSVASASLNCRASSTQTVLVTPNPTVVTAVAGASICVGGTVQMNASGGANYSWSPNTGLNCTTCANPIASPSVTTVYTVTSNASALCKTSATQTITVLPSVTTATSNALTCSGNTVQLQAINGANYSWSPASGLSCSNCSNPIASPSVTTIYTVTSNASSCVSAATQTITIVPYASASYSAGAASASAFPVNIVITNSSTAATSYYWTFTGATLTNTSSATTPNFSANSPGTYSISLIASNGNGCNDTLTSTIVIPDFALAPTIVIPNVFTPNGDGVNDLFFPIMTSFKDANCVIYDRWGAKIYELKTVNDKWNGETEDGKLCPNGTYFYIFKGEDLMKKNYLLKGYVQLLR
jgi:gliding motility-associated-like protein